MRHRLTALLCCLPLVACAACPAPPPAAIGIDANSYYTDAHKGVRNNHYYWEGLAVAAAGGATGEARYLDWGRKVFDAAMAQIQPDGTLPLELARAGKALHYHAFSATPLAMLASILDMHDAQLDALVRFTIDAARDPAPLARRTGFAQEPLDLGSQSWLAIHARYPRLGGDLSLANPLEHVAETRK